MMEDIDSRLGQIRGGVLPKRHNARTIAALTGNPGCVRRAIMDAAGVDKEKVAARVGYPTSIGRMSDLAVARGKSFEARVTAEGCAELLRLLREQLGLPIPQAHYRDLHIEDAENPRTRYLRSRSELSTTADSGPDAGTLFDHPLLRLQVGGVWVYLEPDVVAFQLNDRFYVVEIKSFPVIDGSGDAGKVAAAATQSAVYVLALRALMADTGRNPDLVSHEVILVCPKDFTNQATAALVDVRKHLTVLSRQLQRMDGIEALLRALPEDVTFDLALDESKEPTRPAADLAHSLKLIDARYAPQCLASCEMAKFCRAEATGSTASLGRAVREDLGGIPSVGTALALADGSLQPTVDQAEAAEVLQLAYRMRAECLNAGSRR